MVKLISITLLVFLFIGTTSVNSNAERVDSILKFLFESAIETDRRQSYNWHFATKENPIIRQELISKTESGSTYRIYGIWEANPFVAGTSRAEFDEIVDITKDLVNAIPEIIPNRNISRLVYTCITLAELYVIYGNNKDNKIHGFPEIWAISYSWKF